MEPAAASLWRATGALVRGAPIDPATAPSRDALQRHLLAPLAYSAGLSALRADYIAAALHAERRAQFLDEVVAAARPIPVLRLKGIAYVGRHYPDPALRPMTDIDLLVPERAWHEVVSRLRAIGYRDDGKRNQRSPVNHAITLRRAESAVDVHRSMVQAGRMELDLRAVWTQAIPVGDGTWVAAPDHEYLLHVAHMARHEFAVPLIAMVDAARLAAAAPGAEDLAPAWRLARAHRVVTTYLSALRMGRAVNPWPFPGTEELAQAAPPRRAIQVARKVAIHDRVRDLPGFLWGGLRTRLGV